MSRLPPPYGTAIDRGRALPFSFEGERLSGLAGDTIASALAANGRWVLSRSFKYHRPRGIQAVGLHEAAALVQLAGEPNVDAGTRLLEEGMAVTAQNVAGSLRRDRAAVIGRLARFLPVGFYYRTFFRPGPRAWLRLWEPLIRRAAGLGTVDPAARGPDFEKRHLHADVAVIGGGLAGMEAALAAAAGGAEVVLVERDLVLGGSRADGPPDAELERLRAAVAAEPRIAVMPGARCTGWFPDGELLVAAGTELVKLRAARTVLATGSYPRPLLFPGNDLPGVMFAETARRLMWRHAVLPGNRAVVAAAESGDRIAGDLAAAGVTVARVVDLAAGERILSAEGGWHLAAATVAAAGGRQERVACDLLVVAAGSVPAYHLALQAGGRLVAGPDGTRIEGLPEAVRFAGGPAAPWPPIPVPDGAYVDLDEDVTAKDIRNAIADGYRDVELVKRFTTVGMGTSQGRLSGLAAAELVAAETGAAPDGVRITTVRPPDGPEELGRLAGPAFAPVARTPMHEEHRAAGAVLRGIGGWLRPAFYPGVADPVAAEVRLVRERAGLLDVSTLGKIEVRGGEAGAFLDRLYTMSHAGQQAGRVRYGLMLNEMGSVMDDGVVARLAEDHFYVTATSSGVEHVFRWMLRWRARWGMAVDLRNVTSAYGAMNLAGPRARAVLERLEGTVDVAAAAFPYLGIRTGMLAGVPVRAMRIGFAGELAYELHAPRSLSAHLWRAVLAAGAAEGLRPYGVEASRVLRLEKGHIIVGQDTDAMTTPAEIGFDWAVSRKKPFFIGKRALAMAGRRVPPRRLVGFSVAAAEAAAVEEALAVLDGDAPSGSVTSTAQSPSLGRIGMAMVPAALAERDHLVIQVPDGRRLRAARRALPFYDPGNARQEQ